MKESDVAASLGRIVLIRTTEGEEWEAVLKRRAPNNGHWQVKNPEGKIVAVTAEQILGLKETKEAHSESEPPVASADRKPDKSWTLADLAIFITLAVRRSGLDAWWIAKALHIARAKHKKERDWLRWLRDDVGGISKSTAYRYLEIYDTFSLEEVEGQPLNALYKLMRVQDEDDDSASDGPEEPASDAKEMDADDRAAPANDAPGGADQEEPAIAGRIAGKASSAAGEQDGDGEADDDQKLPDEPQPPITAAEIDLLTTFIEAVGGLVRAEYVFEQGVQQLRELKDED